jgi:hypothetical protein
VESVRNGINELGVMEDFFLDFKFDCQIINSLNQAIIDWQYFDTFYSANLNRKAVKLV